MRPSPRTAVEEEQEDAKWRAVMMATADALTEVHLMFMATLGEMVWGTPQGNQGWGITAQPDQCRCPQVE